MTPQIQDDQAARERIRNSLDESLIVEASAGTGKTSELVRRIVRVLQTGLTEIDKIVAVTFTNKAAGELKLRLRQGLDEARGLTREPAEVRHIEDALEHLEEAAIGTIHAFCAQILRERPVEAEVDPAFVELSQPEADRIYQRAFRGWIQQKLGESAPGLRRAFARIAWQDPFGDWSPMQQLQETGRKLVEWRDFPAGWRTVEFDRAAAVDALANRVKDLAAMCQRCRNSRDDLRRALEPLCELEVWIERAEESSPRDYDAMEGRLLHLLRDLKRNHRSGRGRFADGVDRAEVLARRGELLEDLEQFRRFADADLAAVLRAEMGSLVDRYQELKRRSGKLDFVDLLILVRDLLRGWPEVRAYLQQRFTHIFVDEFQDTDPLQVEILLLLAADDPAQTGWQSAAPKPGKLFVVGDPKQSIYKFRRADVLLYRQVCDAAVRARRGTGAPHQQLPRLAADSGVRQRRLCSGDDGRRRDRPGRLRAAGKASRAFLAISRVWSPCPRRGPTAIAASPRRAIDACLPDALVAFVDWLVHESGWQVRDMRQSRRAGARVRAAHLPALPPLRNFGKDLTRDYVRGFEARGIPHLLVGSKSFHRREEVETLRAALSAIEWPDDELSVFAALKGSLFAIPDSTLLRFRHEIGSLHPFRRRVPAGPAATTDSSPSRRPCNFWPDLHRERNRRPIADTINAVAGADARPRRLCPASRRPPGAGQRLSHLRPGPQLRNRRRHLLPRLCRRVGCAGRESRNRPKRRCSKKAPRACA